MRQPRDKGDSSANRLWLSVIHLMFKVAGHTRPLLAEHGLTGPQWAVMHNLVRSGPEGMRLSDLSRRLQVTEGNVTGLVDRLEEAGMVARTPSPDDRRVVMARLTLPGEELAARVTPLFLRRLAKLFAALPSADRDALADTLERLTQQVEEAGAACQDESAAVPAAGKRDVEGQ